MKKIAISRINELLTKLAEFSAVYAPQEKAGAVNFYPFKADSKVVLNTNTVKSVKDVFFPQCEDLVDFKTAGKNISITQVAPVKEEFVVFGVRACDVRSFDILDKVFLVEPKDAYYCARRAGGTIISLACAMPEETCFCTTFGIDPSAPKGDVATYIIGEELAWQPLTRKGEALTNAAGTLLQDAPDNILDEEISKIKETMQKLPLSGITTAGFGGDKLQELFDRKEWDALSSSCIGCGSCTYICPTCQCYDVRDYNTGNGVSRYRCWDSCMCNDFTMMAHGTPRTTKLQRFRQRFMHKLVYFPANNQGEFSCVGCGRCVAKCPVSMNIVKVIKTLGGKE